MQPKVSVVIPCYNNEKNIVKQFNSVLKQTWSNIELILVNDGSTDNTDKVITEFTVKFLKRGFEVIIIEQKNQGVAAAVKSGFMRVTGEFLCQIDQDDEIDPEYVASMAGYMDSNNYDLCISDFTVIDSAGNSNRYYDYFRNDYSMERLVEKTILNTIAHNVWVWMVRKTYFDSCEVLKTYICDQAGTQEPSFWLPLLAYGGKIKHIKKPLYHYYFGDGTNTSDHKGNARNFIEFNNAIYNTTEEVIKKLRVYNDSYKRYLINLNRLSAICNIAETLCTTEEWGTILNEISGEEISRLIYDLFAIKMDCDKCKQNLPMLYNAVKLKAFQKTPYTLSKTYNSIIGYGALGMRGRANIPMLKGTRYEPTEIWDIAGDGVAVKKPDIASLTGNDLVILFPLGLKLDNVNADVIAIDEIISVMAFDLFPELFVNIR